MIIIWVALMLTALLVTPTFAEESAEDTTTELLKVTTNVKQPTTIITPTPIVHKIKPQSFHGNKGPWYSTFEKDDPKSEFEVVKADVPIKIIPIRGPRYQTLKNNDPNSEVETVNIPVKSTKQEDDEWRTLRTLLNSFGYPGLDSSGRRKPKHKFDY